MANTQQSINGVVTPILIQGVKVNSDGNVILCNITSYADDTAAAVAGIPIGGFYNTAGAVKVRLA